MRSKSKLLAMALITALLAGCSGGGGNDTENVNSNTENGTQAAVTESTAPSEPAEESGGDAKTTLVVGERQEIQGTIPYDLGTSTTSAFEKIYDALTERDANGTVIPSLAKDWEAVSDTSWLFYLEEGVTFTNGEILDAEAVRFTWEVLSEGDTGWGNINDLLTVIADVQVVDAYTVQIDTIEPFGNLPLRLTMYRVLPPDYYREVGPEGLREHPIGSGPYKYVDFSLSEYYIFEANPDHWRGEPAIKEITYRQIPDASARVMALEAGDVDFITDVAISEIDRLAANDNLEIGYKPSTFTYFAQFNTYNNEALKDVRVRKALTMAVDVDIIIDAVFNGYAKKVNTCIFNESYDFFDPSVERETYDLEEARALLEEAGYGEGLTLDLTINPANYGMVDTAQIIAAQLSEIGVTINVVEKEAGIIREQYSTKDNGDIVITGTGGTQGDGGLVTNIAFSLTGRYSLWSDPEIDELRAQCEASVDPEEQAELYTRLQQMAKDQCVGIPLWQSYNIYAYDANLENWEPHATSLTIFRDAYWAE